MAADKEEIMGRDELRAMQRPIKDRYEREPETALITLRAEGQLDEQGIMCSVATGRELVRAGLHPATGGSGALACSGDMLLQALAACAGVTLRSVATALDIDVTGTVEVEGDLDFRGTLGVARDDHVPVGFRGIRLSFDLRTDESDERLGTLLSLTERYCVVYQTLAGGVPVTVQLKPTA
jgi:uncharacterized OsmC-like protein